MNETESTSNETETEPTPGAGPSEAEPDNLFEYSLRDRIHAARCVAPEVKKDQWNSHGKFWFAGVASVMNAVNPLLKRFRIGLEYELDHLYLDPLGAGHFVAVFKFRLVNVDDPKDFLESRIPGISPRQTKGADPTGQQSGSATSYALKSFLSIHFGIKEGLDRCLDDPSTEGAAEREENDADESVEGFVRRFNNAQTSQDIEDVSEAARAIGFTGRDKRSLVAARDRALDRVGSND